MADEYISFDDAVTMLKEQLNYPETRALNFVKRFDKNKDGRLSVAEFRLFRNKIEETKTQLESKFNEYDRDQNGFITLREASEILQKPPFHFPADRVVDLLKGFDKDGNGMLDISEFAGFYAEAKATNEEVAAHFELLDADHNGVLSPDEVVTVIQDRLGLDEKMARYLITMFDQNKDGSLDKTEFMNLWSSMFGQ